MSEGLITRHVKRSYYIPYGSWTYVFITMHAPCPCLSNRFSGRRAILLLFFSECVLTGATGVYYCIQNYTVSHNAYTPTKACLATDLWRRGHCSRPDFGECFTHFAGTPGQQRWQLRQRSDLRRVIVRPVLLGAWLLRQRRRVLRRWLSSSVRCVRQLSWHKRRNRP